MTNSFAPEPGDTILTLPTGTSGAEMVNRCREAALELVNESKGWGKAELGTWLIASYGPLVKHVLTGDPSAMWPVPLLGDIDARLVGRMLESARAEIFETLGQVAKDGSAAFALRALISGFVIRCEDGARSPVWMPTAATTRLADRVLSLFAVDYLARPADYEAELAVCVACQTVRFDSTSRHCGACRSATMTSMLAPRRRATIPYPFLDEAVGQSRLSVMTQGPW